MVVTIDLVLYLIAAMCFLLAALEVPLRVSLRDLAGFFLVLSLIV